MSFQTLPNSELPATYVEGWSNLESVRKIPYHQLGQTQMNVSLLTLGMYNKELIIINSKIYTVIPQYCAVSRIMQIYFV